MKLWVLFLAFVSVGSSAATLEIVGTGDGIELLRTLATEYEKKNPDDRVIIPGSIGSSGGIRQVGTKQYVLGRVARKIKPKEERFGLDYEPWALSPVVFFTKKNLNVGSLSTRQILDIYSGKLTNWKDITGEDQKIRVITREQTDSSLSVLKKKLPGFAELTLLPNHLVTTTTQKNLLAVSTYDGSIGYGPLHDVVAAGLSYIKMDGLEPNDPEWPLVTEFGFVYFTENRTGLVARFLDFIGSPAGQSILKQHHMTYFSK